MTGESMFNYLLGEVVESEIDLLEKASDGSCAIWHRETIKLLQAAINGQTPNCDSISGGDEAMNAYHECGLELQQIPIVLTGNLTYFMLYEKLAAEAEGACRSTSARCTGNK